MAASQSGRAPQVGEQFDSYDELKERVFNHEFDRGLQCRGGGYSHVKA